MEMRKGYKYFIEDAEYKERFAEGILALINLKCLDKSILDIRTYNNSYALSVVSLIAIDELLEGHFGEISSKETISTHAIEFDDLNSDIQELLTKLYSADDMDYFVYCNSAELN